MIKEVLEVSQENYNPSRLMTNTTYRNIQYKRKDMENIFTLQLFSLAFVFKFMTILSHFPGSTAYHGSNFIYNYFFQLLPAFFAPHASDDLSQDYRNKVISHFYGVNIDVLLMNTLGTPKAQFLLMVKIPQDA